ncbi:IspD/TarI family cytidylyltransferase [Lacrimispora sp.]|uniref:IspD/TarI family cytidylyltransferase n=1 Tax=Lacrimispora sp. TaxID=2719234 RepID=UPI0028ADE102|nr:2-C-methyl-D-erythritol 4-phosphate cytidylyltransferase [Lacrimispora sp.]
MIKSMQYSAILLGAGRGTRYKGAKQDVLFHDKPLWRYAYETALDIVGESRIIAVGKDIPGGETRTGSVLKGLEALPTDTERVVIVEAARPMVRKEQILQLLTDTHPSTSFVRPLVNTIIYRDGRYINREELYDLLTPQAFDYKLLLEAYGSGKFSDMTDETRVMFEFHGIKPHFIETGSNLFKVTYPGDLDIIESIYRTQVKGNADINE